jgi:hypothetical protein
LRWRRGVLYGKHRRTKAEFVVHLDVRVDFDH